MKIIKFITPIILAFTLTFVSSCNYLNVDDYFVDTFSQDSVFVNRINLNKYLWNVAGMFPDEGRIWSGNETPGLLASGELFSQRDDYWYSGVHFSMGNITPDNQMTLRHAWPRSYQIIRRCNNIFQNINECKDLSALERKEILGYTHFIRAYAYYLLFVDYGPLPLVGDELMETNREPEYYAIPRATYDETADYICEEFEQAAQMMPSTVTISQFGRPTSGAALALIARVRLMQASPSYNGGLSAKRYFSNWKRTIDDEYYVSQEYDDNKWAIAAAACKRVIDSGMYNLHIVSPSVDAAALPSNVSLEPFPNGAGNVDPYRSYKDMFSGESVPFRNPELIWARVSEHVQTYTRSSFPYMELGGWNDMCVPQVFIDAFYMEDGRDISNPSISYPYDEVGFTTSPKSRWGYEQMSNVYNMYNNREWRFYANIGFHGCFWPCASTIEDIKKNKVVTYSTDGYAGKNKTGSDMRLYPITGYVCKKFIHDQDAWSGQGRTVLEKTFPIIRYAEILLSYVEALNNMKQSHIIDGVTYTRDIEEMRKYFNMIRFRVGLPGVKDEQLFSAKKFQEVIEREWMIEFFSENRYYYNIRRWGTMEECMKEPIMGMNTDAPESAGYFTRTVVNHPFARYRCSEKKLIFMPIARSEVRKNFKLDQNPGWE